MHPTHNPKPTYGWIRTGVRKELLTNTGRQRLNLTESIDIVSRKVLLQEDKTLNAESTVTLLRKIENAYPQSTVIHYYEKFSDFRDAVCLSIEVSLKRRKKMTTSMLYHAYGIAGVNHTSTKYEGGQVIIAAEMTHNSIYCPKCRHYQGIFRGKTVRRFH